ncbi:hypothetical protein [Streptomyces sp. rh34]|uniref:hypothetical protein n=1 Tax=Streptomyces sp. rh34 TaxID=2034272 RepID=UPI0015CF7B2F|nr:hypothetical protein [Streptomyces sp. rh34]
MRSRFVLGAAIVGVPLALALLGPLFEGKAARGEDLARGQAGRACSDHARSPHD